MGLGKKAIDRMTPDICEFSGLGEYLQMPVRTYSTGMLMRLAFSISTSVQADILLMDEWLSVGDAEFLERAPKQVVEGMRVKLAENKAQQKKIRESLEGLA